MPLLVNRFPNKLAPNVAHNILRNPPFCRFASFLIVSLTHFINKLDYSRDLITFIMSFISLLESVYVILPHPNMYLSIAASVAAAVNPNDIKTLLPIGLSTFPIKGNPDLKNPLIVLFYAAEFLIILH